MFKQLKKRGKKIALTVLLRLSRLSKKQVIFLSAISVAVIAGGIVGVIAVSNRGDAPYIYLKLDEGHNGTHYNSGTGSLTATSSGVTWQNEENCIAGKCLYFDGSGDSVSVPDFDL